MQLLQPKGTNRAFDLIELDSEDFAMADLATSPLPQQPVNALTIVTETPRLLRLELLVTDADSITELLQHEEGADRDDYALCALQVGLLSLKHARGQIDVESVKREGDCGLSQIRWSTNSPCPNRR
jgi:hypothetical protein